MGYNIRTSFSFINRVGNRLVIYRTLGFRYICEVNSTIEDRNKLATLRLLGGEEIFEVGIVNI